MMRAWENRGDTAVWDEPLYAYYLNATGLPHPGAAEVIAAGEIDAAAVIDAMLGEVPGGKRAFFLKLMTHHLLDAVDRDWFTCVTHCCLIRDPREVIASYARARPDAEITMEDVGVPQAAQIYDAVCELTGSPPPVLDGADVLRDPRAMLTRLCDAVGLPFTERMLSWPAGPRDTDGAWAPHWYANVEASTGFARYEPKGHTLPASLEPLAAACEQDYRRLWDVRLRVD